MKELFYFSLLMILFSGCARTYNTINPAMYNFENKKDASESITVSYLYNLQEINSNKPYARKERKKHIRLVALKIENNSDEQEILDPSNFIIKSSGGRNIRVIPPEEYCKEIRQYSETFVLFYALGGIGYKYENVNGETTHEFAYNPIPAVIGLGNAIFAENANRKQKKNLIEHNVFNKPIPGKSSIYGLIAIDDPTFSELNFLYYKK